MKLSVLLLEVFDLDVNNTIIIQMGQITSMEQMEVMEERKQYHLFGSDSSSSTDSLDQISENESRFQNHMIEVPSFSIKPTPFTQHHPTKNKSQSAIPEKELSWMEVFYHPQLFENILDYLTYKEDQTLILCSHHMRSQIFLRRAKRSQNWSTTFLILKQKIDSDMYSYFCQSQQQSEHSLDLDRTFSFFPEDDLDLQVPKLDRVMKALSFSIPYFQGLNSIVAVFLAFYNENQTYWLSRYLINKTGHLHNNQEIYIQFLEEVDRQIETKNPRVFQHLEKNDLDVGYFAMKWIMGLFSYDLHKDLLMKLWDLICLYGLASLKWFIVSIFKVLKETILRLNGDEINEKLKNELKELMDGETGIKTIESTKEMLIQERFKTEPIVAVSVEEINSI